MLRSFAIVLILNLLGAATLFADAPPPQPEKDQPVILTYDVSDLLSTPQDYPLAQSLWAQNDAEQTSSAPPTNSQALFNGSSQSSPTSEANPTVITADSLVATIKQMTQPDLNISHLGKMLIVQATPDIQQKIQGMLNSMHAQQSAQSGMVSTQIFWLTLNPSEVASIAGKGKTDNNAAPMPEVPDSMIDASHLYSEAQTMCLNGQMIYVVAGRSQSYVSNLTPIVGSNAVGLSPEISKALSGATLQIRPQLLSGGKATVDLASVVDEADQPQKELSMAEGSLGSKPTTRPSASVNTAMTVESVKVLQQEFHTTVRLPLGKKILIGGMTLEPAAKDQAGRQLFLAIQVDAVQ